MVDMRRHLGVLLMTWDILIIFGVCWLIYRIAWVFLARYGIRRFGGLRLLNAISRYVFLQNITSPVSTHFTSQVIAGENITIGEGVARSFAQSGNCYFQAKNGIEIGDYALIGPGSKLISSIRDKTHFDRNSHYDEAPIVIGENVWIGSNVVILPGVELATGVIVGAGAVVTKSIGTECAVIAGNPAKIIGHRYKEDL